MIVTKYTVSLALAKQLAEAAMNEASMHGLKVSIAIVGEGGELCYFVKMDGSSNISGNTAVLKAQHAVNYQRDSKYHEEFLKQGHLRVLALPNALPIEGGVQLVHQNSLIGAIGVSGASAVDDGKIALAAVAHLSTISM